MECSLTDSEKIIHTTIDYWLLIRECIYFYFAYCILCHSEPGPDTYLCLVLRFRYTHDRDIHRYIDTSNLRDIFALFLEKMMFILIRLGWERGSLSLPEKKMSTRTWYELYSLSLSFLFYKRQATSDTRIRISKSDARISAIRADMLMIHAFLQKHSDTCQCPVSFWLSLRYELIRH